MFDGLLKSIRDMASTGKPKPPTDFAHQQAEWETTHDTKLYMMTDHPERAFFCSYTRTIDLAMAERFLEFIEGLEGDTAIDIILHSSGGTADASDIIVRTMLAHSGKIRVFIPRLAMSAASVIALAADEIHMCRLARLGQIDPQLGYGFSVPRIQRIPIKKMGQTWVRDMCILAQCYTEKFHADSNQKFQEISRYHAWAGNRAERINDLFCSGKHSHNRALFYRDVVGVLPHLSLLEKDSLWCVMINRMAFPGSATTRARSMFDSLGDARKDAPVPRECTGASRDRSPLARFSLTPPTIARRIPKSPSPVPPAKSEESETPKRDVGTGTEDTQSLLGSLDPGPVDMQSLLGSIDPALITAALSMISDLKLDKQPTKATKNSLGNKE